MDQLRLRTFIFVISADIPGFSSLKEDNFGRNHPETKKPAEMKRAAILKLIFGML